MRAEYARQYRDLWERHWWWRSREAHVLGWVETLRRRAPGPDWNILDVGCGDGLFFGPLGRFGRVEGLEPDGSLVTDPRWRDRIRVGGLGEGSPPLPAGAYDLVLMLDVLEHLADDRAALRAVLGSLRPGGRLLLTVPALNWLWSRHDEVNLHYRRYDRGSLRSALEEAGFRVEALRYFFFWTVVPLLARRWISPAGREVASDRPVRIPPGPVNRLLTAASRTEHALGRLIPWPLGSSLLAVARRPSGGPAP